MKSFMGDGTSQDEFTKNNIENNRSYDKLNKKYNARAKLDRINENTQFELMDEGDIGEMPQLDEELLIGSMDTLDFNGNGIPDKDE